MMEHISRIIIDSGILFFFLAIIATFLVAYCVALLLNAISLRIEDKNRWALWMTDIVTGPVVMFVITAGYGVGSVFLRLSLPVKTTMEHSVVVLSVINGAWLLYNTAAFIVAKTFRSITPKALGAIKLIVALSCGIAVIALFNQRPVSLILGTGLALGFIMISQRLTIVKTPEELKTTTIPKKIVITHVFISNQEPREAVLMAIDLIKNAITENENTDKAVSVTLSGFKPHAFDILVHYSIKEGKNTEHVKQEVNLAIIQELHDKDIRLSGVDGST